MKRVPFLAFLVPAFAANLVPVPSHMNMREGRLVIDSGFTLAVAPGSRQDRRLVPRTERFVERLSRETGIPIRQGAPIAGRLTLEISCAAAGPAYPKLGEGRESPAGSISRRREAHGANNDWGFCEVWRLLLNSTEAGPDGFFVPALTIEDKPRFPWRGLMLDVSRHWMPLPVVERNLDAMAAVKMNVFHWHLSDDQGFRVESKRFPKLQQLGSDGHFYTQAEVRRLVEYAADRGIRVIPEFDIPGHATSLAGRLSTVRERPGTLYEIERKWGIFQPTIDPSRETTYVFLDAFLAEMAGLFPDPYFHIGGDEIDDTQWKASPHIQAFARQHGFATSPDLHAYFNRRIQAVLKKHGKTMMGWDEDSARRHSNRCCDSVLAREGIPGGSREERVSRHSFQRLLPRSSRYRGFSLPERSGGDPSGHILGGEACMWTEYVDTETVDSRIWPRAPRLPKGSGLPRTFRISVPSRPAGSGQPVAGLDWRAAPFELHCHAGSHCRDRPKVPSG